MKPENRNQLVRGYVVVADRYAPVVGKDAPGCITAYTFWYRHDSNLAKLEQELEALARVYKRYHDNLSGMTGYEYKDYVTY